MGLKVRVIAEKEVSASALLAASVAGLSRASSDRLVKSGEVKVNGARVRSNVKLAAGDELTAFVPDSLVKRIDIPTVYEDDNIVVFDKPKHTPYDVIPSAVGADEIIAVHRLDTNTEGLIVFAKTQAAADELESAFRDRRVTKVYIAEVSPPPKARNATLTAYMKMSSSGKAIVSSSRKAGVTAVTEYEEIERHGDTAVLRVTPHTGRTHQIRAHLAFVGCPIVGDGKYGKIALPDGQKLIAKELTFDGLCGKLAYLNGKTFVSSAELDRRI